jgi:hypothetical protein
MARVFGMNAKMATNIGESDWFVILNPYIRASFFLAFDKG